MTTHELRFGELKTAVVCQQGFPHSEKRIKFFEFLVEEKPFTLKRGAFCFQREPQNSKKPLCEPQNRILTDLASENGL